MSYSFQILHRHYAQADFLARNHRRLKFRFRRCRCCIKINKRKDFFEILHSLDFLNLCPMFSAKEHWFCPTLLLPFREGKILICLLKWAILDWIDSVHNFLWIVIYLMSPLKEQNESHSTFHRLSSIRGGYNSHHRMSLH